MSRRVTHARDTKGGWSLKGGQESATQKKVSTNQQVRLALVPKANHRLTIFNCSGDATEFNLVPNDDLGPIESAMTRSACAEYL